MSDGITVPRQAGAIALAEAVETAWLEADLLDRRDYRTWLDLWIPHGLYIVPIDADDGADFATTLNYAYDDDAMRRMRVDRLDGGYAISTTPPAATIRTLSRFRLETASAERAVLRCAQHLVAYKHETQRLFAADVTYHLAASPEGLRLERKIVRLINAGDALAGIGFLP